MLSYPSSRKLLAGWLVQATMLCLMPTGCPPCRAATTTWRLEGSWSFMVHCVHICVQPRRTKFGLSMPLCACTCYSVRALLQHACQQKSTHLGFALCFICFRTILCAGFHSMLPRQGGVLGWKEWIKMAWYYIRTPRFNPLTVWVCHTVLLI